MRIATMQQHNMGLNAILRNQAEVSKTQQQVSSGRKVLTPADDPVGATKILQMQQSMALSSQYVRNMDAADNRLKSEEAAFHTISDRIARLKELTVDAGNGSYSLPDRQADAAEIHQIQEQLVDLFNTKDAGGEYIFAGFKGSTPPFEKQPTGRYEYQGDEGQRKLSIGNSTQVATGDHGKRLFVDVEAAKNTFTSSLSPKNSGDLQINPGFVVDEEKYAEHYPTDLVITFNPESAVSPKGQNFTVRRLSDDRPIEGMENIAYSPGSNIKVAGMSINISGDPEAGDQVFMKTAPKQSITDTIFRLTDGLNRLGDNPEDSETLEILIADTLTNLTNAEASLSTVRSELGARMNIIENTRNLAADVKVVNSEILSKLQDVDHAEAVSRLSLQTYLLEAAQQSYTKISRMSLFNSM